MSIHSAGLQSSESAGGPALSQRLMSVDALRGFDMFWIIGADSLVYALNRMSHSRTTEFLATQLEHKDWVGFNFYDLIFPLFIFIMGVSTVFSLSKTLEREGRNAALKRLFRRSLLLYLVGVFYSSGLAYPWPNIRLMGVLNRIAIAYFFGGLLFCFLKPRQLAGAALAILLGYWAAVALVPIRDIQLTKASLAAAAEQRGDSAAAELIRTEGNPSSSSNREPWMAAQKVFFGTTNRVTGKFDRGYNLPDHVDFQFLPGRKYDHYFDPEGYLSTLPAVVTCLLGVFAGLLLQNQTVPGPRKVALLLAWGAAGVALGWIWHLQFPVIKKIWTSSYVLVAGGYSAWLLALFYWLVDVRQFRSWCQPFVWMGMNSITIYLASNILGGFRQLASRFVAGDVRQFFEHHVAQGFGDFVVSLTGLLLAFWLVWFLYKRKIFLRL